MFTFICYSLSGHKDGDVVAHHGTLGDLTKEEYMMLRREPAGMHRDEQYTPERLAAIRSQLRSGGPRCSADVGGIKPRHPAAFSYFTDQSAAASQQEG